MCLSFYDSKLFKHSDLHCVHVLYIYNDYTHIYHRRGFLSTCAYCEISKKLHLYMRLNIGCMCLKVDT